MRARRRGLIGGLIALNLGPRSGPIAASDPKPENGWDCGCSPNREQKQVHIVERNAEVLNGPTNHESANDSKENVEGCAEAVVP